MIRRLIKATVLNPFVWAVLLMLIVQSANTPLHMHTHGF
jgi:hypothetical protein